ncbi:hypothetical protein G7085_14130 [Tessaracoccus sp. HDW20]|uniref:hypothetical protein n=1 Tax=Tessaracoccus coleopterorum TaxID=2714950 RepID=UPI0018D36028|nr:hypothetical protein [Tessaracoccus coleopterorum]NHB85374.1 hypothetical protein [Tessaracoccus coleopterorum]
MTDPKQIETLPPLGELVKGTTLSPRTGEPPRPVAAWISAAASYLAVAVVIAVYALHWWLAAHPGTYPTSARLIAWVAPDPGKWLSLTLEGVLAAASVLAAGAVGVAGFQAWNGWRWSRWAGLVGLLLMGGFAAVTSDWAFIGVGLALVTAVLAFLPPMSRYFAAWAEVRSPGTTPTAGRRASSTGASPLPVNGPAHTPRDSIGSLRARQSAKNQAIRATGAIQKTKYQVP